MHGLTNLLAKAFGLAGHECPQRWQGVDLIASGPLHVAAGSFYILFLTKNYNTPGHVRDS
jgi:hypothetical protein